MCRLVCSLSATNLRVLSESTACWVCCVSWARVKGQSHITVYLTLQEKYRVQFNIQAWEHGH